jgi:fibronectin type 3 domain-containing protein
VKSLLGSPAATSFNDTTATPGLTYYYWVTACRSAKCSGYSAYDTGWRNLTAPTNVLASDGTYTNKVQVTWVASSGATSYQVYRAESAAGAKSLLGSPTGILFNDTTATPGITYFYWVKACKGANCSGFSATDTGWRNLTAPTNVQASDGTYTNKVQVSWVASSGATTYQVYRATSAAGVKSLLGSPTGTLFNDTTATPGVTYYYWVTACRGTRCSGYSSYNTGWRSH